MTTTEADGASEGAQELVSALRSAAATEGWAGAQESHIQAVDNAQRALLSYIASLEARVEVARQALESANPMEAYVQGFKAGQCHGQNETLERGKNGRLLRDRQIKDNEWSYSPYACSEEHEYFVAARRALRQPQEVGDAEE